MNRGFLPNILFVVAINLLVKPVYIFGIDRVVQNRVGAEDYGLFFALFNLVYLLQFLNDFGVQNYSQAHFSRSPHLLVKYLPKTLFVKTILIVVFVMVTLLLAASFGYRGLAWTLLIFVLFNQILASLILLLRTTLSADGWYRLDSTLSVVDKLLLILGLGYWLFFTQNNLQIEHFVWAQTAAFSLTLLLAVAIVIRKMGIRRWVPQIDWAYLRWLLRGSYPFAMVLLLMTLYTRMDAVMLERLLTDGQEQAGIYAAAYRILDASNMLGLLFAGLLLPMFAKELDNIEQLKNLIRTASSLLLTIAIIWCVGVSYFADPIMQWLYVQADSSWGEVFRWLIWSFLGISIMYIFSTYLTASQRMRQMNRIFAIGVCLNFALNLALIFSLGALGAAIATVITQSLIAAALVFNVMRSLGWRVYRTAWLRALLFTGLLWLGLELLDQSTLSWQWQFLTYGIVALSMSRLLGLWSLSNLSRWQ